jgi:hypothetical protein
MLVFLLMEKKYLMMETGGVSDEVAKSITEFFHLIYNLHTLVSDPPLIVKQVLMME